MNIIYDGMPVVYRITLIFTTLPLPFFLSFFLFVFYARKLESYAYIVAVKEFLLT